MASTCERGCLPCRRNEDENTESHPIVEEQHGLPTKDYESLDYDKCYNEPYVEMVEDHLQDKWFLTRLEFMKWVVTFFIGVLTALVALFIDQVVKVLSNFKFSTVEKSILHCSEDGCLAFSLLIMLAFNLSFVAIAASFTAWEPASAGSGIPEIKCYLNGVIIPRCVRIKTLVAKATGVLFSVAGGLFVGKEGPMIHSGAVIGAGVPQFQSFAFNKIKLDIPFFRTDRDKRDFVSSGAAAGVAAAFGAPIGGTLFSLEEGSSFWNQKLTWRTFFCSMAATFTLNFFLSGFDLHAWGQFYLPGLINFGAFKCPNDASTCHLWTAWDLLIFLVMGVGGGLLGALFNSINTTLTNYRLKNVIPKGKLVRFVEAFLVALMTTCIAFTAAMTLGQCREILSTDDSEGLRTYFCGNGYYNDMATLMFNSEESAIKQLFHQSSRFSPLSLALFFLFFYVLACWTYGIAVPSGLFVPSLLCGAAYGRLVANLLESVIGYKQVYPGTYALIGAAAFLGGVVRMTISLTVILIESTNEITYGLPIMVVLMVAKWVGDLFNEGLYDIHIELKDVPMLGWEAPPRLEKVHARDIMSSNLSYIYPQSRVQSIIDILATTKHHAFPVVTVVTREHDEEEERIERRLSMRQPALRLHTESTLSVVNQERELQPMVMQPTPCLKFWGLILRSQLIALLNYQISYPCDETPASQAKLSYSELTSAYPRYPDIHDLDYSDLDRSTLMDVTPYMNPCPYIIRPNTPVPQVFNLFRGLGLRHLPVINHFGECVGMIARHNLTEHHLHSSMQALQTERLAETTSSSHDRY